MTDTDTTLLHELTVASQKLVAACNIAANVLSEEFESLVQGPAEEVKSILARCPTPTQAWDGSFREEDLDITLFHTDDQFRNDDPRGVTIRHKILGFEGTSKSKRTRKENEEAVRAYIERRLEEHRASGMAT